VARCFRKTWHLGLTCFNWQAGKTQALDVKLASMQSERAAAIGEIASLKGEVIRLRSQLDHTASISGDSQVKTSQKAKSQRLLKWTNGKRSRFWSGGVKHDEIHETLNPRKTQATVSIWGTGRGGSQNQHIAAK
jgi:hypothetical protein